MLYMVLHLYDAHNMSEHENEQKTNFTKVLYSMITMCNCKNTQGVVTTLL